MTEENVVYAGDEANEPHNQYDSGKYAVEQPHGADVEVATHLVDEIGHSEPPQNRPEEDGDVAGDIVIGLEFRREETETREKTYYKEEYQRIGEREEESGAEILPIAVGLHGRGLERPRRVGHKKIGGIDYQDNRAYYLKQALV